DAGEVVDDRDRRDVVRDLDQLAGRAALRRLRQLIGVEGRVAAGESRVPARDELIAATARADRVIGDGRAGVLILKVRCPSLLCGLLSARPRAGEGARDAGAPAVVAGTAGGGGEREYSRGSRNEQPLPVHGVAPLSLVERGRRLKKTRDPPGPLPALHPAK